MIKKGMIIFILLFVQSIFFVSTAQNQFAPFQFGPNKPHLLFHLGTRQQISFNMGYGYWLSQPDQYAYKFRTVMTGQQRFSPERLWYQNTQSQLYVDMKVHDGQKMFEQDVLDNRFKVKTNFKYQFMSKEKGVSEWQSQISIKDYKIDETGQKIFNNSKAKTLINHTDYQKGDLYWFNYFVIQNSDTRLVNKKDYFSPVVFRPKKISNNEATIDIEFINKNKKGQFQYEQTQSIKLTLDNSNGKDYPDEALNLYAFTVNISQSFDVRSMVNQFKHLIELDLFASYGVQRRNDTKMIEWENNQLQAIRDGSFPHRYTYLFIYGKIKRSDIKLGNPKIFITNSTSSKFSSQNFNNNKVALNKKYFPQESSGQHSKFLKHVIFNLYGGMTYYSGKLYTQNSMISHNHDYSYTFTPSRLIFPRSFLWDDGFHMLVGLKYRPDIMIKIINNWVRKIDLFGWMGREQIRGYQMSSLMPDSKFVFQDVFQMNPPTFILPILKLIQLYKNSSLSLRDSKSLQQLLQSSFEKLEKNFRYFQKTQSHFDLMYKQDLNRTIKYRWRCKDQCALGNFMGSGLDDYPRFQKQGQISKQHIDLSSWLFLYADGLQKIAQFLDYKMQKIYYKNWKNTIKKKVIKQCLDESDLLFKDLAIKSKSKYIDQKVSKIGYINLFPFFTGLSVPSEQNTLQENDLLEKTIEKTVDIMSNQELLMSQGGIRSLSKNDSQFESGQNYWRGAVWMPINFMILRACKKYYLNNPNIKNKQLQTKIESFYNQLKKRLTSTVENNWQKTGYLFQNYHEGKGNRGYPFYGWTSLIANIIAQDY